MNPIARAAAHVFYSPDAGAVTDDSFPWILDPYKLGKRAGQGIMGTSPVDSPDESGASNVKFWITIGVLVAAAVTAYVLFRKGGSSGGGSQLVVVK